MKKMITDPSDCATARAKALDILKFSDRTEAELRRKLHEKGFDEQAVDDAIAYVSDYHYIDDVRYAESYLRYHRTEHSLRELWQKLMVKGVSRSDFDKALFSFSEEISDEPGQYAEDPEVMAAVNCMKKKLRGSFDDASAKGQKMLAYMYRKGFEADTVRSAIRILEEENLSGG